MGGMSFLANAHAGFFGKLPARGDFVRAGLPGSFVAPWDAWMSDALAASQDALGPVWLDAWLQAPIWNFALASGVCGPDAVLGLWMASLDRAGRKYPMTIALTAGTTPVPMLIEHGGGFLAMAEEAGLDALEQDLDPDALAGLVDRAYRDDPRPIPAMAGRDGEALWWTLGSPFVPERSLVQTKLPDRGQFASMLDARNIEGGAR